VAAAELLAEEFPEATEAGYMLFADLATLITQAEKERQAYEQVGYTFTGEATYNVAGEANWTPFASDISDAGATMVRLVGEGENLALLQQALREVGYEPEVTFQGANFYDQEYIAAAGGAAEGTFVETVFWPFEEADENAATARYLELLEAQGGKVALLGAQSMSGWLLFATAARDCDREGDLSRTCVMETAAAMEDWTGGGLHAPTSPGTNEGASCQIVLQVEDDGFVRHAPEDGFACDDSYLVEVEPGTS
jgi:ABC-type branched-subunit amino acid transport system substrate-binding protein